MMTWRLLKFIVIREAAVRECLALMEKLAAGMAHDRPPDRLPADTDSYFFVRYVATTYPHHEHPQNVVLDAG